MKTNAWPFENTLPDMLISVLQIIVPFPSWGQLCVWFGQQGHLCCFWAAIAFTQVYQDRCFCNILRNRISAKLFSVLNLLEVL